MSTDLADAENFAHQYQLSVDTSLKHKAEVYRLVEKMKTNYTELVLAHKVLYKAAGGDTNVRLREPNAELDKKILNQNVLLENFERLVDNFAMESSNTLGLLEMKDKAATKSNEQRCIMLQSQLTDAIQHIREMETEIMNLKEEGAMEALKAEVSSLRSVVQQMKKLTLTTVKNFRSQFDDIKQHLKERISDIFSSQVQTLSVSIPPIVEVIESNAASLAATAAVEAMTPRPSVRYYDTGVQYTSDKPKVCGPRALPTALRRHYYCEGELLDALNEGSKLWVRATFWAAYYKHKFNWCKHFLTERENRHRTTGRRHDTLEVKEKLNYIGQHMKRWESLSEKWAERQITALRARGNLWKLRSKLSESSQSYRFPTLEMPRMNVVYTSHDHVLGGSSEGGNAISICTSMPPIAQNAKTLVPIKPVIPSGRIAHRQVQRVFKFGVLGHQYSKPNSFHFMGEK